MRSPVADLLDDLRRALEAARTRWYLFGAQAALLYGAVRLTADVDVTVDWPHGSQPDALVDALAAHGFVLRVADPAFVARTRVLPLVHAPTSLPLDAVLAGPGLEDAFFARVVEHDVEGVRVPVASPEDIVVMKVLAARTKDLDDVAAIAASPVPLDLTYLRRTVALLEEALGQSDLQPVLDAALRRARRRED
jgi:hypothetical protein